MQLDPATFCQFSPDLLTGAIGDRFAATLSREMKNKSVQYPGGLHLLVNEFSQKHFAVVLTPAVHLTQFKKYLFSVKKKKKSKLEEM